MSLTFPLTLPTTRRPAQVQFIGRSVVGMSASPFTLSQEVFEHQGDLWLAQVALPRMGRADAEAYVGFLLSLRGRVGTFLMGDPSNLAPQGTWAGTPLVNGALAAGVTTLVMDGFSAAATAKAGDVFQAGSGSAAHLHKVVKDATADGSGNMTLEIWPRLRAPLADNAALVTASPVGVWRLQSNDQAWSVEPAMIYGISFDAQEAL